MSDLLDAFTKFVAYLGDEGARDGYFIGRNERDQPKYSINVGPSVSPNYIVQIVTLIYKHLTTGKEIKGNFAPAIQKKIEEFVATVKAGSEAEKHELLAYMAEYNLDDNGGMQGGTRRMRRRSKGRRSTTKPNKHKARGSKRTRVAKRRY
jgi:hypothetical protein